MEQVDYVNRLGELYKDDLLKSCEHNVIFQILFFYLSWASRFGVLFSPRVLKQPLRQGSQDPRIKGIAHQTNKSRNLKCHPLIAHSDIKKNTRT